MSEIDFSANVTYNDTEPDSFTVTGDRTRWYYHYDDGVATLSRVEVRDDEHSTENRVVLFGGEWVGCMEFVEGLEFVDSVDVDEGF